MITIRPAKPRDGSEVPWVPKKNLTEPPWWHKLIICNDDCDNCPLNTDQGCAKNCFRFPDLVCEGCPCRASKFAPEDINE